MKVMWIGHGGLLFISGRNKILIDPYLSNLMHAENKTLKRRMPIKKKLFSIKPDVTILTSSHPDRADFNTVKKLESKRSRSYTPPVLACENAFKSVKSWKLKKKLNLIMFEKGLEWTVGNLHILAVDAKSDDRSAFGLIITDKEDGKKYYVASSTLYSEELISKLPEDIYAAFLPISGTFGAMNMADASRFSEKLNAKFVVPVQFGMFDKTSPDQFIAYGKIVPQIYTVIDFSGQSDPLLETLDKRYNEIDTIKAFEAPVSKKDEQAKPCKEISVDGGKSQDEIIDLNELDLGDQLKPITDGKAEKKAEEKVDEKTKK